MEQEVYEVGDKVKHPKFGQGTVTLRQGEGDTLKLTVKFGGEVGEKKLMVKFANLKRLQERPTLPAAPAAEAASAPLPTPGRTKLSAAPDDDDDDDINIDLGDDDEDADGDLGDDEEVADEDEDE